MTRTAKMNEPLRHDHEAVGLFDDEDQMQEAIRELEATAFPRDAISIRGYAPTANENNPDAPAIDPDALEDDPEALREAPVRNEELTIGGAVAIACTAYIGAVAGVGIVGTASMAITYTAILIGGLAGAFIAAIVVNRMRELRNNHIRQQINHGGMVMWVRTPDKEREELACNILTRHGATHVRVHDMP